MTISARRVAVQGFGASVLLVAVQGLLPITVSTPTLGGGGGFVGSTHISQSEWLRRLKERELQPQTVAVAEPTTADQNAALRLRRRREEELLLILS